MPAPVDPGVGKLLLELHQASVLWPPTEVRGLFLLASDSLVMGRAFISMADASGLLFSPRIRGGKQSVERVFRSKGGQMTAWRGRMIRRATGRASETHLVLLPGFVAFATLKTPSD